MLAACCLHNLGEGVGNTGVDEGSRRSKAKLKNKVRNKREDVARTNHVRTCRSSMALVFHTPDCALHRTGTSSGS